MNDAIRRQRDYYRRTAREYDREHALEVEHVRAVEILAAAIAGNGWKSVLEVGCGTGRVGRKLLTAVPCLEWSGVDPSTDLLARLGDGFVGRSTVADGNSLPFPDRSFDVVYAFAVLHHVPHPARVIDEMLRVSRCAVFISDSNNFGQGRPLVRAIKRGIRKLGLWRAADWFNTRGRGYHFSEGDGVFYSFSVFSHLDRLRSASRQVTVTGLRGEADPYRDAGTVALLAIK